MSETIEQKKELTPDQERYWETWNHPNCVKSRHERLWNPDGSPRRDRFCSPGQEGRPRHLYVEKIEAMTDQELDSETYSMIYQSARCANNRIPPDWDWMCDCCYDEIMRRDRTSDRYGRIHDRVRRDHT
jgi:hypothetical protein